jgi:hypothetical protein
MCCMIITIILILRPRKFELLNIPGKIFRALSKHVDNFNVTILRGEGTSNQTRVSVKLACLL